MMRSFRTLIFVAGALSLTACNKTAVDDGNTSAAMATETNDAMASENVADVNVAEANVAANGLEGTGNPIGPGKPAGGTSTTSAPATTGE